MVGIDPISIGLTLASTLFGGHEQTAADRAAEAQTKLTNMIAGQYSRYSPEVLAYLMNYIKNPYSLQDALDRRQLEGDMSAYEGQQLADLQRSMPGNENGSSFLRDAAVGLKSANFGKLAALLASQQAGRQQRAMNAAQMVGGMVGQNVGSALNSYSGLTNYHQGRADDTASTIGKFMQVMSTQVPKGPVINTDGDYVPGTYGTPPIVPPQFPNSPGHPWGQPWDINKPLDGGTKTNWKYGVDADAIDWGDNK